jgi:hypothetical protein
MLYALIHGVVIIFGLALAGAIVLGCQVLVTGDRTRFGPFY